MPILENQTMTDLEKMLLAFLNRKYLNRKQLNRFFVFKLDKEEDGLYLGFGYEQWSDTHDKCYLKIDKQDFRMWKINQILMTFMIDRKRSCQKYRLDGKG